MANEIIATHGGRYHADELVAISLLKILYPTASVVRLTKKESDLDADFVVDRGKVFNPTIGRFDHHQGKLPIVRSNGIKYASTGLVWEYMYEKIVYAALTCYKSRMPEDIAENWEAISTQVQHAMQYVKLRFDEAMCQPIDSWDDGNYPDDASTHLSSLVWDMAVSGCSFSEALTTVSTLVEARLLSTLVGNIRFGIFLKGEGVELRDSGLLVSRLVYVKGLQWAKNKLRHLPTVAVVSPSPDTKQTWVLFSEPGKGIPTRITFRSLERAIQYHEDNSTNINCSATHRPSLGKRSASTTSHSAEGDADAADSDGSDK
jgi:hypothetical protein